MIPPAWVCERLKEIDPSIRLGWAGRPSLPDEMNPGSFMMVKLYHVRDAERTIAGTPWLLSRDGPVYSPAKRGGVTTRPDWNPEKYRPFFLAELSIEDVFSGYVCVLLRRWNTPWVERKRANLEMQAADYDSSRRDLSEQTADYAVWRSNQTGATRPEALPYKMLTKKDKASLDERPTDNPYRRELEQLDKSIASPGGRIL